jgi:toxin ParE1/3/4
MSVHLSWRAKRDLLQIGRYLTQRNPSAANDILSQIHKKFDQLAHFPFIGRERSSMASGVRSALVGTHLIFYVMQDEQIIIVRVIDGRMDIDAEFRR